LVMEGYMPSYPKNPFIKRGNLVPRIILHDIGWNPGFPNGQTWRRTIGGDDNTKMVEVFGPPPAWIFGMLELKGDLWVIPPFPDLSAGGQGIWQGRTTKEPTEDEFRNPGSRLLVGNFSYVPRLNQQCWLLWNLSHDVAGYTLAAYGTLKNLGQDVYDRNGEYYPRQRAATCALANQLGIGLPCQEPGDNSPNTRYISRGGPDTQPDGVIIVLDSGVDKKSMNPSEEVS